MIVERIDTASRRIKDAGLHVAFLIETEAIVYGLCSDGTWQDKERDMSGRYNRPNFNKLYERGPRGNRPDAITL